MKLKSFFALVLIALLGACASKNPDNYAGSSSKREFRGAWIQCVNGQFQGKGTVAMQQELTRQLDELQKDGVNAIIFQVRPECDALYESKYEPWSRFLTGVQGQAPSPYWDPLDWMVKQCHKRGMELHAWLNPYRASTKGTTVFANNHIAVTHPERVFSYDGLRILNPGIAANRDYICQVVEDIVRRYDVDGIHIDDYFYPYPAAGQQIPDDKEFAQNNNGFKNKGDWRRDNVNVFIKQMGERIKKVKPWVKFGVSPFGIYRNKKSAPEVGSETNGLQNYDDLYADVLMWVNNGWIDYCVPQIYWEIGNKAADYQTLIVWWDKHAANRHLYIGEDVERTVKYADVKNPNTNQMPAKFKLHAQMRNVKGTVLWYSKAVADNVGNYGTVLRKSYWKSPALPPQMPFIDGSAPKKPASVADHWRPDGYYLTWKMPAASKWNDEVTRFVVYRFEAGEKVDIGNASKIVAITSQTEYKLPYENGKTPCTYVVTSLDRLSNESKMVKKKVKL